MAHIYKIENKLNNSVYIGQTINILYRLRQHKSNLKNDRHPNTHLQASWNKYGSDVFTFSILEECPEDSLDYKEQYWLDFYKSETKVYNFGIFIKSPLRKISPCIICGKESRRNRGGRILKTCSEECLHILLSQNIKKRFITDKMRESSIKNGLANKGRILSDKRCPVCNESCKRTRYKTATCISKTCGKDFCIKTLQGRRGTLCALCGNNSRRIYPSGRISSYCRDCDIFKQKKNRLIRFSLPKKGS